MRLFVLVIIMSVICIRSSVLYPMKRSVSLDEICAIKVNYCESKDAFDLILGKLIILIDRTEPVFDAELAFLGAAQDIDALCQKYLVGSKLRCEIYKSFNTAMGSQKLFVGEVKSLLLAAKSTEDNPEGYAYTKLLCDNYLDIYYADDDDSDDD